MSESGDANEPLYRLARRYNRNLFSERVTHTNAKQFPHLHDWPATEAEAIALQHSLVASIDTSAPSTRPIEYVAGCDIAYHLTEPQLFAAVVVLKVSDLSIVEERLTSREVIFPYIPGLLSFREIPALLDTFAELRQPPGAVMLDGQGIAYPRRFGLACHLGLWLDLPCVGCAKSWLAGDHAEPGPNAGDAMPLTVNGETVGAVVRSATKVKPVYVSPGHKIDVPGATALERANLSGYHHPAPTRAAHMAANRLRSGGWCWCLVFGLAATQRGSRQRFDTKHETPSGSLSGFRQSARRTGVGATAYTIHRVSSG